MSALMQFSAGGTPVAERTLADATAHVRAVLAAAAGNRSRSADILDLDRKTLRDESNTMLQKTP